MWDVPDKKTIQNIRQSVFDFEIPVRFVINQKGSLNNRFFVPILKTLAVFNIDDDIMIRPKGIVKCFEVWKKHKHLIINFSRHQIETAAWSGRSFYKTQWPSAWHESGHLGLTLAGGTMIHQKYLHLYFENTKMLSVVNSKHNCEDIAMNWVVEKELRKRRQREHGTNIFVYPPMVFFFHSFFFY